MKTQQYSDISGLDRSVTQVVAPQVNFLWLDNFIPSNIRGDIVKRGGSTYYSTTGSVLGLFGYKKLGSSLKLPTTEIPLRHRRNGSTSYIEKYSWATDTWSSITLGASTAFSNGDVARAAQVGNVLAIAGGKPAKLLDPVAGAVSRLGGPGPTAAATVATGIAGSLTGTYYYVYTFYDSTSGWESSPSPMSVVVSPSSQKVDLSAMQTTVYRENIDKKRIYRTISTGEQPFLRVAEITLATTTYTDDLADVSLGASAPSIGDHDAPPDDAYIVASHLSRFWIPDGSSLYYSLPYTGNAVDLEYFSAARALTFPSYVTGVISMANGAMYVFCPPGFGIWEVRGRSSSEFEVVPFLTSEGTNFPSSIAPHNDEFCYWGAQGPRLVRGDYLVPTFGDGVRPLVDEVVDKDFTTDMFVWAQYYPPDNQFIFGFTGTIEGIGEWRLDGGSVLDWADSETGIIYGWELVP